MPLQIIDKNMQFAVIGLGNFGMNLAISLIEEGADVIVLDNEKANIEKIKEKTYHAYLLDATSEEALKEAGVDGVDCAIVCIGLDLVANILTTLLLKNFKIPRLLARANTEEHAQILRLIGVNDVIQPEIETGKKLAKKLISLSGYIMSYDELSKDYGIVEIKINKKINDSTLAELDLRKKFRINVIAVKHLVEKLDDSYNNINDYEINEVPDPGMPLRENDILVIIGRKENINKFHDFILGK